MKNLSVWFAKGRKSPFIMSCSKYWLLDSGQINSATLILLLSIAIFSAILGFNVTQYSPKVVIAILCAIAIGIITLVKVDFGLIILLFSMLWSPEIPIAQTIEKAVVLRLDDFLIIAVFFAWLAKVAINKELGLFRKTPLNLPIFAYLAVNILSTLLGIFSGDVNPKVSFFYILKYFEFFMIYFLFANNLNNMKQLKTFIFCFLLTAFTIGIFTYAQIGTVDMPTTAPFTVDRPTAPFEGEHSEPNTLGAYLLLCLSITLGLFLSLDFSLGKNILAGLFCFNIYPFLMTLSRSAYVGFIFSFICFIFLTKKAKLLLVAVFAISAVLLPFIAPKKTIDRVIYTFTGNKPVGETLGLDIKIDDSAASRIEIWSYAVDKFKDRPFFGYGVTGLGLIDSQYARTLGELGVLGFLSLLWLISAVIKNTWHIYHIVNEGYSNGLVLGFLCGFLGLLVAGFGANIFIIVRISEPLWFLAACVMVLPEVQEAQEAQTIEESQQIGSPKL